MKNKNHLLEKVFFQLEMINGSIRFKIFGLVIFESKKFRTLANLVGRKSKIIKNDLFWWSNFSQLFEE